MSRQAATPFYTVGCMHKNIDNQTIDGERQINWPISPNAVQGRQT